MSFPETGQKQRRCVRARADSLAWKAVLRRASAVEPPSWGVISELRVPSHRDLDRGTRSGDVLWYLTP
jgi:hypothetical protein